MPVSVVVGGQYGSEGKGKVSSYLARKYAATAVIRVGGPNSGHSAIDESGNLVTLRQLPAGIVNSGAQAILPPGSLINVAILLDEIARLGLQQNRVRIDERASLVTAEHARSEAASELTATIGSTGSGTGAALLERISRRGNHLLARDCPELAPYLERDTVSYVRSLIRQGKHVVIEGTQGFGLSLWQSYDYPFATSRDTTAANFTAEAGIAPHNVDEVVLVIRTFPIRVGGNSGPMKGEISWDELSRSAHLPRGYVEYTTATHRVRRVGRFDADIVKGAIISNAPHIIVMNHMDYIDPLGKTGYPSYRSTRFVQAVESAIDQQVDLLGYGPELLVSPSSIDSRKTG